MKEYILMEHSKYFAMRVITDLMRQIVFIQDLHVLICSWNLELGLKMRMQDANVHKSLST
jgi:hypothetical protein